MAQIHSNAWKRVNNRARRGKPRIAAGWGNGRCTIANNSSLRKRMRAARRGLLPSEVLQKIALATSQKALMRHKWYKKKMQALLGALDV